MVKADTTSRNAGHIANYAAGFFEERPVCILIPIEEWVKLNGKDEVESFDYTSELPTLSDLMKKKVVFVHYDAISERNYIEEVWRDLVNDAVIEIRLV